MIKDSIYCAPEEEGLASEQVLRFLDAVQERKINLHSFMLSRRGKILAEGYYAPFNADFKHRLYSSSKTFVSAAIGRLIGEGKIRLSDRLVDYFPEYLAEKSGKWISECTVEDALMMSVPLLTDSYSADCREWAKSFFAAGEVKPGGTIFDYNTSGTFILDVLVEKLTGMSFLEYLRPVFDKIGVGREIRCVKSPDGYSWGGSGVVCTLRDFAKFAELIMHRGEYNGEQLISKDYMIRATTKRIETLVENTYSPIRSNGYGYQIWMTDAGFCLSGMGLQMAYCFPDKDLLFVCNGDTQCSYDTASTAVYDMVKYFFYDETVETKLPSGRAYARLTERLKTLELCSDFGAPHSSIEKEVNGKTFTLRENPMGWKDFRLELGENEGALHYRNARGSKQIRFGLGKVVPGKFPETHYYDWQVGVPANRELDCICAGGWFEPHKFLLRVYITDSNLGNCFMTFSFRGEEVGVLLRKRAEFFMDDYQGFAGGSRAKS